MNASLEDIIRGRPTEIFASDFVGIFGYTKDVGASGADANSSDNISIKSVMGKESTSTSSFPRLTSKARFFESLVLSGYLQLVQHTGPDGTLWLQTRYCDYSAVVLHMWLFTCMFFWCFF